jgi:hypothetical protein
LLLSAAAAAAQPALQDEITLDDYLAALAQVSPAARDGAEAYRSAFARRCGRALTVRELRRLVAEGDGDPVLMAMIRAKAQQDEPAIVALAPSIACSRR